MSDNVLLDSAIVNKFFKAFKAIFIDVERGDESTLLNTLGKPNDTLTREDDEYFERILSSIDNALFPFLKYVYDKRKTLVFDLPKETEWALASMILLTLACLIKGQYTAARLYMESINNVINDCPDINKLMTVDNSNSWFKRLTTHSAEESMSKSLITIIRIGSALKKYTENQLPDEPPQRKSPLTTSDQLLTFSQVYKKYGLSINESSNFYSVCFDGFSPCDIWRLTIDGRQQFRGTYAWLDWEANAAQAIHHLWDYIKDSSQLSPHALTEETLKAIHEHATLGVNIAVRQTTPGIYRVDEDDVVRFTLKIGRDTSVMGLMDLYARVSNSNYYSLSLKHQDILESGGTGFTWDSNIIKDIPSEVRETLSQYEKEITAFYRQAEERRNCRQLLRIIINCAKNIVLIHPFHDGNGRTAHALLNLLLLRNKLPPTILYTPGVIAAYSEDELVEEILQGMDNFFHVKKHKSYPKANYTTAKIISEASNDERMRSKLISDFFRAIAVNDSALIAQYIAMGFDIKTTDAMRNNALMVAASNGHIKLLEQFLEQDKASISRKNNEGHTALYHAAFCGQKDVVVFLLGKSKEFQDEDLKSDCVASLMLAILKGDEDIFNILLNEVGENLYEKDDRNNNLLMLAATNGSVRIFSELLKRWDKAKLGETNRDGNNILMLAAKYGHRAIFEILFDKFKNDKASLEHLNNNLCNALMLAVQDVIPKKPGVWGMNDIPSWQIKPSRAVSEPRVEREGDRSAIASELLRTSLGDHLEKTDDRGNTALMLAIRSDNIKAFYALLRFFSKDLANHQNVYRDTALTFALMQENKKYAEALLPFYSKEILYGDVVLRLAVKNRRHDVLEYIVENHAAEDCEKEAIYKSHQYMPSILADSIYMNDKAIFDLLLPLCQDKLIFEAEHSEETLLMVAARSTDNHFLKTLLDISSKEVFDRTRFGKTALFDAVISNCQENMDLILDKASHLLYVKDSSGDNALMCAARWGCNKAVNYFVSKCAIDFLREKNQEQQTALMIAALENRVESFELLLNQSDDALVRDKDCNGYSVLMLAAHKGHLRILAILLKNYNSIDFINDTSMRNQTAVMLAVTQGRTAVVEKLIAMGCDLYAVDENDDNALMLAIKGHRLATVKLLIQHYTAKQLLEKNSLGNNALMLAANFYGWEQQENLFKLLLVASPPAALYTQNNDGNTVLMLAAEKNNLAAVKLLLAANPKPIINATNHNRKTAFSLAVARNSTDAAVLLCKPSLLSAIRSKDSDMIKSIFSEQCCPPEMLDFAISVNPILMQEIFSDLPNLKVGGVHQLAYGGLYDYVSSRKKQVGLHSLQKAETVPLKKLGLIYILGLRLSRASDQPWLVQEQTKAYIDVLKKQSSILRPRIFGDKSYSLIGYVDKFITQLKHQDLSGDESSSYVC